MPFKLLGLYNFKAVGLIRGECCICEIFDYFIVVE